MSSFKARPIALATLALALTLSASAAHAGLINNYDFNGSNGTFNTFTSTGSEAGGPTLSVRGYLRGNNNVWGLEQVSRTTNALGARTDPNDANDGQVGPRIEGLLLDLGSTVFGSFQLDFSQFVGTDNADIWVSTTDIIANNFGGATQVADDNANNPFISNAMHFRYIFVANTSSVAGNCANAGSNCFRIDNLRVVPEPGSLALVGGALMFAGTVRRRRRTS